MEKLDGTVLVSRTGHIAYLEPIDVGKTRLKAGRSAMIGMSHYERQIRAAEARDRRRRLVTVLFWVAVATAVTITAILYC